MQFDYPDANVHAEKRSVTTTPMQKLFVLNSPFVIERSRDLATQLTARKQDRDAARIGRAYQLLFGREPSQAETSIALEFLGQARDSDLSPWTQYVQMLLASNEMLYID